MLYMYIYIKISKNIFNLSNLDTKNDPSITFKKKKNIISIQLFPLYNETDIVHVNEQPEAISLGVYKLVLRL